MKPIWIVDDDPSIRFVLEKALARETMCTRSFSHPAEVLEALAVVSDSNNELAPQVLISDIRMPGGSGLLLLEQVHALQPGLPVIIMTAYSDLDSAVSAFQRGAFEYLPKPFDVNKAVELVRRAVQESQREEVVHESAEVSAEMLGQAPAMQDVFRAIGRLSQSQVTVLITGESGSGKELVARALHKHSPVAQGPFVAINTAAIPKDLLESELFGHERGAFTGAQTQRRGRFEQAESGTLFLDEIGDMPFELQTRLLRVLSDGHFYRVGGHSAVRSKVRVIAATHQHLEQSVKDGSFREDLYHRLNVIRLRLPALRERPEDIPMLTSHFLQISARQLGVQPKRIGDGALTKLREFSFPGNVRQLENVCHWLTVMAPSQIISVQDLPPEVLSAAQAEVDSIKSSATRDSRVSREQALLDSTARERFEPPEDAGSAALLGSALAANDRPDEVTSRGNLNFQSSSDFEVTWEQLLEREVERLLAAGTDDVWSAVSNRFEVCVITSALRLTHGKRIEAAQRLGIGRNTITRKIHELNVAR